MSSDDTARAERPCSNPMCPLAYAHDGPCAPKDFNTARALAQLIDAKFDDYAPRYSEAGECVGSNAADAGLAWLREQLLSPQAVEAAAWKMFEPDGTGAGDYTWSQMVAEDPIRADIWRADARAALTAAIEAIR